MSARSVSLDNGPAIPGTVFRHMITADDTGGRFSAQSAVLAPRELVIPHSHEREDEFTLVYRGRMGGLVGEEETEVDEGGTRSRMVTTIRSCRESGAPNDAQAIEDVVAATD